MTKIDLTILEKRIFSTTPKKINSTILEFCKAINPSELPIIVAVKPETESVISECFFNVAGKVSRDGGKIIYGWNIWEWSRVFLEAEHHAVWEKDGVMTDITPKANNERKILFLPDPQRIYDFDSQKRIINIKQCTGKYPSIASWLNIEDEFQVACEKNSIGNKFTFHKTEWDYHQQRRLTARLAVIVDLAASTSPRNVCICASGKEFRKCCAKFFRAD